VDFALTTIAEKSVTRRAVLSLVKAVRIEA